VKQDYIVKGNDLTLTLALFACLISRTFSANKQYFPLITNQRTVLSVMAFQQSEQGSEQSTIDRSSRALGWSSLVAYLSLL
jgi:hypothetical protein